MSGTPCLSMPNTRTEAEVRAAGHTGTPWYIVPTIESGTHVFNIFKEKGKYALPVRCATEADAYFVLLAANSYDAMRGALERLLNDSMFKDHPAASQMAIDALALARGIKIQPQERKGA